MLKMEQYPLPAMQIDELSFEGTLNIFETIITKTCNLKGNGLKSMVLFLGLSTVTIYGYSRTVYGWLTGIDCPIYSPSRGLNSKAVVS